MMLVDEAMQAATQLQREGKLEQAEILLRRILEIRPAHAHALHLLGIVAYQAGNLALAIQLIEQAIKSNPHVALFYSNLGEMHRILKAISLSIQYGQHAVALAPNSAIILSNLGIAYYDAKQYEQAENCHKRALIINPKLSCSLNNMGSIYKAYGQIKKATEFYQAAISASPHFIEPLNNLGVLFLQEQEFKQAWECFNHAITLAPTFADAHCNLGLTLLGLHQSDKALFHFEKTLQLNPQYAEAYYGLAKTHLHKQHFSESEHFLRKAIEIKPQEVEFYQLLAEIYHAQGKNSQALAYINQALSMDANLNTSYLLKGTILMECGEASQAEEQFIKSITDTSMNTNAMAHYSLVQLSKIKPNHFSLNALLSMANHHTISADKLAYVHFALGKCHDDMGEWAKAFEYFTKGGQIKRSSLTYDIAEQIEFTDKLLRSFTQQTIEYLQDFAHPSALPIFIVGMPRSGSTLVEHILSSHSQVFGAGELKYLNELIPWPIHSEDSLYLSAEKYQTLAEKYLSFLQRFSPNAMRITDKMPHNFIALGFIHALFPNAKIIHVKRNPIDTCLSCYTQLFTEGHLYSYDLAELGQYYRCYERIMDHWRHLLPPNAWLEVEYENVVNHLEIEAKRLIDFCGLTWEPACLDFHQSSRQVRTASLMQVRQPIYTSSVERWRRYEHQLAPLIKELAAQQQV